MNKVILMGRLTRDPNIRYTQQNGSQESMCVARYTLAVDRRGARDGQQSADFISCVAFGRSLMIHGSLFCNIYPSVTILDAKFVFPSCPLSINCLLREPE